jgi:hypothetical protein
MNSKEMNSNMSSGPSRTPLNAFSQRPAVPIKQPHKTDIAEFDRLLVALSAPPRGG